MLNVWRGPVMCSDISMVAVDNEEITFEQRCDKAVVKAVPVPWRLATKCSVHFLFHQVEHVLGFELEQMRPLIDVYHVW